MVCSKQLYKEALNHTFDEPKQWEIREINEIMNQCIDRWRYFPNPRMFSEYGRQKGWERENPATDSGNPSEKTMDDFVEVTEQMELGNHTDVLSLCPKAVGIPMVLRGMNPQVIAVDEITAEEDIRAMCLAANCGVGLLASIHAASVDELHQKPLWRELLRARVFRRCIVIRSNGGARSYEVGDLPCSD